MQNAKFSCFDTVRSVLLRSNFYAHPFKKFKNLSVGVGQGAQIEITMTTARHGNQFVSDTGLLNAACRRTAWLYGTPLS